MIWILHYCAFKIVSPTTHGATRLLANLWELDYTGACGDYNGQNMLQGKCKERVWNFFCIKHRYNPNNFWSIRQNSQYRHKLIFKEIVNTDTNWFLKKYCITVAILWLTYIENDWRKKQLANVYKYRYNNAQIQIYQIQHIWQHRNTYSYKYDYNILEIHSISTWKAGDCSLYWDKLKNNKTK